MVADGEADELAVRQKQKEMTLDAAQAACEALRPQMEAHAQAVLAVERVQVALKARQGMEAKLAVELQEFEASRGEAVVEGEASRAKAQVRRP